MVAKRVRDSLPLKLSAHWEVNITSEDVLKEISLNSAGSINSEDTPIISADEDSRASIDLEEADKHPEIFQILKESFPKAFRVMDRELRLHPSIDCFCSGTTAVALVKQVSLLYVFDTCLHIAFVWYIFMLINTWAAFSGSGSCHWKCRGLKSCIGYTR